MPYSTVTVYLIFDIRMSNIEYPANFIYVFLVCNLFAVLSSVQQFFYVVFFSDINMFAKGLLYGLSVTIRDSTE